MYSLALFFLPQINGVPTPTPLLLFTLSSHIIRALLLYMPKLNSCYLHVCIVTTSCQYSYDIHTLTGVCESASYHVTTAAGFVISTANTWSVDPERVPVVYISHIRRVLFLYICLLSLGCVCSYYPSS